MTDTNTSRYGSAASIQSVDDAIDRIVHEAQAEYPSSEEDPFRHGYEFCVRAALKGLGLNGPDLDRTVSLVCQSVTAVFTPRAGTLVYADSSEASVSEEGTVVDVLTHRIAVDFGSGTPEWYPRSAFVQRDKPYVDTTKKLS